MVCSYWALVSLVVSRTHQWCQTLSPEESDCDAWCRRCMFGVNSWCLNGLRSCFIICGELLFLKFCHGIGNSGASLEHAGASARWLGSM